MRHTQLTTRNYASFASVMLAVGLVTTGFGTIDVLMVAPKGVNHVAAVGQGGLIVLAVSVFFLGLVEAFAGRLAVAEGEGTTVQRLPVLGSALLLAMGLCQAAGFAVAVATSPVLDLLGQDRELIPLIGSYVDVRMYGIASVLLYTALNEALKICDAKNVSLVTLVLGLVATAVLNWVFLYTDFSRLFASPESAVAYSTLIAQLLMAGLAGWMFVVRMRERGMRLLRPTWPAVLEEFRLTAPAGAGVGARHVNDYMGSIVPMMFIGTMGVETLAAAVVATRIYTVFCRIPQACVQATFVYYGYAIGRDGATRASTVRTLLSYTAVPTVVGGLAVMATSSWLVAAFASDGLDRGLAASLLMAYLIYLPAYIFDQSLSTMLIVHRRGALLFGSSTVLTYLVTIPLAWYSAFVLDSAFLALACNGVAVAIQAAIYWRALRAELRTGTEALVA